MMQVSWPAIKEVRCQCSTRTRLQRREAEQFRKMIVISAVLFGFLLSTVRGCASNAECSAFEMCVNMTCVPNAGCPPCAAGQVCVPPNCVPAPPTVTTTLAPATTTAAPTTTPPRSCPPQWVQFNNYCYIVSVPGRFLFSQASNWCTQTGSRVVWFNQTDVGTYGSELNFVNGLALGRGVTKYWIGVNKQFGQWVWTNGSPVIFSNWRPSQPDGCCGANVTCVLVNYANFLGQWDDAGCEYLWSNPQGFVCKRPL
ncbi:Collectin-12 [Toxocara canis]|uniref:Collectin-12 n=1 Tax=Toxocara canis TaxID=6265 RepID=A0A0B2VZN0_TOXCA|nr:Collectin-12 [Toxocara canis]